MSAWWWLPIGLAAWFVLSVAVALVVGPILKSCSETRANLDMTSHQS